jgi:hypothetical protein
MDAVTAVTSSAINGLTRSTECVDDVEHMREQLFEVSRRGGFFIFAFSRVQPK